MPKRNQEPPHSSGFKKLKLETSHESHQKTDGVQNITNTNMKRGAIMKGEKGRDIGQKERDLTRKEFLFETKKAP